MNKTLMKNSAVIAIVLVFVALLCGVGFAGVSAYAADNFERTTKVAHLSDVHVLPQEYCNEYSEAFIKKSGSTKMLAQTEATLTTALAEIYEMGADAPMIIVVSGDITSNGEYDAHVRVAQILREATLKIRTVPGHEKFQIFIMPGNHDTYNDGAVSYMPTKEELDACADDAARLELMKNYKARPVRTATSKDIFEIYSDFGYCNCDGRKLGHHSGDCLIAEGTQINYFYESSFWYDSDTVRTNKVDAEGKAYVEYKGFDTRATTQAEDEAFEESNLDFEYLAEAGRIGACSYVATIDGVTVVGVDGNARKYTGETDNEATRTAMGWDETTGGMATRAQIRWIIDETKEEVAAENLVMVNCHYNNIPHFVSQDEVISLFVLDNLDVYTAALANAGIRYHFSGHQHAADIVDAVTQEGNVMYDFETGSLVSYGSGYRIVDFTQKKENGNYSEDVKSTMYSLSKNGEKDAFYYEAYRLDENYLKDGETVVTENSTSAIYGTALEDKKDLYEDGRVMLVKTYLSDSEGNKIGVDKSLAIGLANLLSFNEGGMIGSIVNEGLYDTLKGALKNLDWSFTKTLLGDLIDSLKDFDMLKFNASADGKSFALSAKPERNNDLVAFATDLVNWLLDYDFSYGQNPGGTKISEILVEVFGGHLNGAHGKELTQVVKPLIEKLKDGTFVDFLISTLKDSLIPQLELIVNAPIRFDSKTAELAAGKGFDVTAAMKSKSSGTVDRMVYGLLTTYSFNKEKAKQNGGYYSLKMIIQDVAAIANDLLVTPIDQIKDATLKVLASPIRNVLAGVGSIGKYVDMALGYIDEYMQNSSLMDILRTELLDKYVTPAFCRNLGEYAAYIVTGMATDSTPDGSSWISGGDKLNDYPVFNEKNFNVSTDKLNAKTAFNGKAYYRAKGTDGTLEVTPTIENGLLPSMVSVSFDQSIATSRKIRWFTSIEQNVFDKGTDGKYLAAADYVEGSTRPESFIEYSTNADMKNSTKVKATTKNVDRELPTIDLGIAYFNISHRYKFYNEHEVAINDLQPGTTYYYRLGNDKYGWSDVYSFKTANDGAFRFMAITDIQGSVEKNYVDSAEAMETALKHFEGEDIAFIATMGDNVDNGKNIKQYTWWLDHQRDVWANNMMMPLSGNHEKKNYSLSDVVALPTGATVKETGTYYSYDYNYAHFIVLDTNDLENDQLGEEQTAWLIEDLKKNAENKDTKWTIVMLHKGPYTAGSHAFDADVIGLRKQLTPIFAENGVDLVLQGHDHTYSVSEYIGADGKPVEVKKAKDGSVTKPEGVLYVNLGTMGDKYYNYIYSDEVSIVKRDKASLNEKLQKYVTEEGYLELKETPCFADIQVDKNKLTIATYTVIDGENVLVDNIEIKNGSGFDWNALSTDQIIMIATVAGAIVLIIVLGVVAIVAKKRRNKF